MNQDDMYIWYIILIDEEWSEKYSPSHWINSWQFCAWSVNIEHRRRIQIFSYFYLHASSRSQRALIRYAVHWEKVHLLKRKRISRQIRRNVNLLPFTSFPLVHFLSRRWILTFPFFSEYYAHTYHRIQYDMIRC